jgi:hypothetical protein
VRVLVLRVVFVAVMMVGHTDLPDAKVGMVSIDDGMAERARDRDLVVDLAGEERQSDVLCISVLMLRFA